MALLKFIYNALLRRKNTMRKFKKTVAFVMSMALAVTAFAGCNKKDDSKTGGDASATNGGKVLNIYCWNDEFKRRFEAYYQKDNADKLKGIDVKFIINPNEGGVYQSKLDQALMQQEYVDADKKIDIFLVEADYALKYVDSEISLSMEEIGVTADDMKDQYQYTKDLVTDSKGVVKGSSWQACPGLFAYRRDIAKEVLGTDDPNEVQSKLDTWEKFDAVAAQMKEKGYYMLSGYDDAYRVFSNNLSGKMVDADGNLKIDPALETWAKKTKEYTEKGYNEKSSLWNDTWKQGMGSNGKVFGYFFSTWGINFTLDENASDGAKEGEREGKGTHGKWAACYGPQSYYWGGTWIMAARGTDNKDLVAHIIKVMTCDPTVMEKNTRETLDMTNNKTAMNKIAADTSYQAPILGGQNHIALFVGSADKINMKNVTAYDQAITEEFQKAMKDWFDGAVSSYDDALTNFYKALKTRAPSVWTPENPKA